MNTYPSFFDFLFLNKDASHYDVPVLEESASIPKVIHQTYYTYDAINDVLKQNISRMRAENSGWEYRFYDDAAIVEFISANYGQRFLNYYDRINPKYGAARADFFRYLLMYKVGGIYLDLKSSPTRPLDEIVQSDDRLILSHWGDSPRFAGAGVHDWEFNGKVDGGEIQQWHIIAAPGHPYLRQVIQYVMRNIDCYIPSMHGTGAIGVLCATGPIAYTLALAPLLSQNKHQLVPSHEDIGLDYTIYQTNKWHQSLLRDHYTTLREPIIRVSGFRKSLSAMYVLFHKLRQMKRCNSLTR